MRCWALTLVLCIYVTASAARYDYLELRLAAPQPAAGNKGWSSGTSGGTGYTDAADGPAILPFSLVFPESLGQVAVRPFLDASPQASQAMLTGLSLSGKTLSASERRFLLGLRALSEGKGSQAHELWAATAKGMPSHLKTCFRIDAALLLYMSGFADEAAREWHRALELAGTDGDAAAEGAWRNLYAYYLARGDYHKANGLVEEALQENPRNQWALMAKGFLLRLLGSGEEWEQYLREKSSWKDSLHGIQIAYGRFLKEQGQWAEAIRFYNRGLEGDPGNGPAWLELADAYYREGYLVFSERCIQSAFQAGISDPYVFELYGRVLQDFGELADTGQTMRGLGIRLLDTAWASFQSRRAERILEEGFPKALDSRSMAQLLYRLYCRNGKAEAARNLRDDFWFHFRSPGPTRDAPPLSAKLEKARRSHLASLDSRLSYVTFPWVRTLQEEEFFDAYDSISARFSNTHGQRNRLVD